MLVNLVAGMNCSYLSLIPMASDHPSHLSHSKP
jgi:hypothetical protein